MTDPMTPELPSAFKLAHFDIHSLHIDLLALILSYIPVRPRVLLLTRVCKRWRDVVPYSIEAVTITGGKEGAAPLVSPFSSGDRFAVDSHLRGLSRLRDLSIGTMYCPAFKHEHCEGSFCRAFFGNISRLSSISIQTTRGCFGLQSLLDSNARSLTSLSTHIPISAFPSPELINFPSLTSLSYHDVTCAVLTAENLVSLSISGRATMHLGELAEQRSFPTLRRFRISGAPRPITHATLAKFLDITPTLTELAIGERAECNLQPIAARVASIITSLTPSCVLQRKNPPYQQFLRSMSRLRELCHATEFDKEGLEQIYLPLLRVVASRLEVLHLPDSLFHFAALVETLPSMPLLETLNVALASNAIVSISKWDMPKLRILQLDAYAVGPLAFCDALRNLLAKFPTLRRVTCAMSADYWTGQRDEEIETVLQAVLVYAQERQLEQLRFNGSWLRSSKVLWRLRPQFKWLELCP